MVYQCFRGLLYVDTATKVEKSKSVPRAQFARQIAAFTRQN